MRIDLRSYHIYDTLRGHLEALAASYPELARLEVIGRSYQGRDILAMEITDRTIGAASHKPAMYIEGNMHGGEVAGSQVCLYTCWYLLENFARDDRVARLLRGVTFYVVPRVSPDGAEYCLTTPGSVRSSLRPFPPPDSEEPADGLFPEDLDGDGVIRRIRIPDPEGDWKVSPLDARLMVRRAPREAGGSYYTVFPEGRVYRDGCPVCGPVGPSSVIPRRHPFGLDFNRNYPANWSPLERGAGPFPLSEPETRAVADFIIARPNIAGAMSYHTSGGVIIRPYSTRPDDGMPAGDLAAFEAIGRMGTSETGYPAVSVFSGLNRGHHPTPGDFKDWMYEHLGLVVFSTELWDAARHAGAAGGVTGTGAQPAGTGAQPAATGGDEHRELQLLKWNDERFAGRYFATWTRFDHPELGKVEIGGWDAKRFVTNPPEEFLLDECHRSMMFTLRHAEVLPVLAVTSVSAAALRGSSYLVRAVIANQGYLPTSVTEQAVTMGVARPVRVFLQIEPGVTLLSGKAAVCLGHLEGRVTSAAGSLSAAGGPSSEATVEWVVKGPAGAKVAIEAACPRAGRAVATVALGA